MCYKRGQPLPEALGNAPELFQGLEWVYGAFQELSTCRLNGMGLGSIPWTAIDRYADRYNIVGEDWEDFQYFIGEMDRAWLDVQYKKQKSDKGA